MARSLVLILVCVSLVTASGCRLLGSRGANGGLPVELPNPLGVPMLDRALVMDEISDELDDYFRIYKEERIRLVDSVMTEGWIETHPKIGAGLLEPWHRDSTDGFERLHATLQTIRRFAKVRVIPTGNSYLVDLKVYKELEDKEFPEHATASGRLLRHDNALDIDQNDTVIRQGNAGWIPLGRDISLEQQILANIQKRFAECSGL